MTRLIIRISFAAYIVGIWNSGIEVLFTDLYKCNILLGVSKWRSRAANCICCMSCFSYQRRHYYFVGVRRTSLCFNERKRYSPRTKEYNTIKHLYSDFFTVTNKRLYKTKIKRTRHGKSKIQNTRTSRV